MVRHVKPYSPDDLQSILDDDKIWRRRETTTLVNLIQTVELGAKSPLLRASVPLLYSHWEGFGKLCATKYLEHVGFRAKLYKDLQPSFFYLAVVPTLARITNSPVEQGINLLQEALDKLSDKNREPHRGRVNTKSNLRYDVLKEILLICGIDSSIFSIYGDFIDKEICDPRNAIAHGEEVYPNLDLFRRRRDKMFELMTLLQATFVNSAVNRSYLRAA
jgi:hypothetical protein